MPNPTGTSSTLSGNEHVSGVSAGDITAVQSQYPVPLSDSCHRENIGCDEMGEDPFQQPSVTVKYETGIPVTSIIYTEDVPGVSKAEEILGGTSTHIPVPSTERTSGPRLVVKEPAKSHMSDAVWELVNPLIAITFFRASKVGIRLKGIEWTAFRFRDFRRTDLIYRVKVDSTTAQALMFWDYLGDALDSWGTRLPRYKARVLTDQISLEVLRSTDTKHAV